MIPRDRHISNWSASVSDDFLTAESFHHSEQKSYVGQAERKGITENPSSMLFPSELPADECGNVKGHLQPPEQLEVSSRCEQGIAKQNERKQERGQPAKQL